MIDKFHMLKMRAALLRSARNFFDERGFIEVQTPCLSSEHVIDAHIDPVELPGSALLLPTEHVASRYFLQSSAEFAMKRLLALGVGSIYNLAPVYRAGERSPRHNVEFTMLEWYDVGATMEEAIEQTVALVEQLLRKGRPRIVTYRRLFQETLGFDPIDVTVDLLEKQVADVDEELARSLHGQRDELLDVLMTERVEPMIRQEMVLIKNYPLSQAALARQSDDDPETAERFELIVEGLELANGYGELLDADTLVSRNEINQSKRLATGRKPLPRNSRLIDAMRSGMPACSGVALGFDRIVMLALGTRDIADVLAFPIEDA